MRTKTQIFVASSNLFNVRKRNECPPGGTYGGRFTLDLKSTQDLRMEMEMEMEKGLMWFLIHHSSQEYSFHKTNWSEATLQKYEHVYAIKQAKRNKLKLLERHRTGD